MKIRELAASTYESRGEADAHADPAVLHLGWALVRIGELLDTWEVDDSTGEQLVDRIDTILSREVRS